MDNEGREKVALFRFGVISSLVARKGMSWGEREELIRGIVAKSWEIPGSPRSSISRSTVLHWLSLYERAGAKVEALQPRPRCDRGTTRALDAETEAALVALKRELPAASLPVLLKMARQRHLLPSKISVSLPSLYRLFKRHGLDKDARLPEDRRRFECELVNDMWQSDCMHGPRVLVDGKMRKSYLFAIIDDHSRLIPHAQFYLAENLESFRDCLLCAMEKRGLPRKLYVDNGAAFRSHQLRYGCARLGVALLHATPYTPEGKGKIERFFGSLRKRFLPLLEEPLSLEELNAALSAWIDSDYHHRVHSSTVQTPLERYLAHLSLLRPAPKDLRDYFRTPVRRKVDKDRTVSLNGKIYEAPLGLIGKMVTLLFHEQDPSRIEVLFDETSQGFLLPLNAAINSRVRRTARQQTVLTPEAPSTTKPAYHGGSLFESGESS
jgi:transposase InsO family protein